MPGHDGLDPRLDWSAAGPRSGRFGDVYFSAEDGLGESRAVFLEGCGLPDAWAGRRRFVVGELGFGTGLNIAALLDLWRRTRPADGRLDIFTVEAFPVTAADAARALAAWPELDPVGALLTKRWPAAAPGFHRIDLPELGAVVDVAVLEAQAALRAWSGRADAWFLDGFSPAKNPEMWREEVLDLVAARSAPGARVATFTVAGAVRRGLQARGFEVVKAAGWGRKRERLEARRPGPPVLSAARRRVTVIGAGIAGAAMVAALRREGLTPQLIEAARPGAGASGMPGALVTPRFDLGDAEIAAFYAQALRRARDLFRLEAPHAVIAEGVVQLEHQARDPERFDRIAGQPIWRPGAITRLNAAAASHRLGSGTTRGGLLLSEALVVEPVGLIAALLKNVELITARVGALRRHGDGWQIEDAGGATLAQADAVVICAGFGARALHPGAQVEPVRGQLSIAAGEDLAEAVAWGGYAAPVRGGLAFGATHDRGDASGEVRAEDHRRNLDSLAAALPDLPGRLSSIKLQGRAAVRAVTPDRLPLAGELAPGLFILGGLGSRGFCTAPLLAEHLAAVIGGAPSPLPVELARRLNPLRFTSGAVRTKPEPLHSS